VGRKEREGKGEKAFVVFLVVGSNFFFLRVSRTTFPFLCLSPLEGGVWLRAGKTIRSNPPFCLLVPSSPPGGRGKTKLPSAGFPREEGRRGWGGGVIAITAFTPSFLRSVFPSRGRPRRRCELFGTGSDDGPVGGRRRSGSTFSRETVKGLGRTFSFTQREPAQSPISFLLPSPALPFFEEGREGSVRRRKRRSFSS